MTEFPRTIAICQEDEPDKRSVFEVRNQRNVKNVWEKKLTPEIIEIFTLFITKDVFSLKKLIHRKQFQASDFETVSNYHNAEKITYMPIKSTRSC